jgi:uncharacterized membrane protein YheB (UPF0754 family)
MTRIDEHYELTSKIFNDLLSVILKDIEKSKYKQTAKALFRQQEKIDSLLEAIINAANSSHSFYAIQAITRIVIEHFIVGLFIWTKARINKNDTCGEEYYFQYLISEFFKRQNYELRIEGIKQNILNYNSFQNIITKFPEFKELEEKQLHEVHKVAKQFDIRDMLDYLVNDIGKNDGFLKFHNIMLTALTEYNNLSSYIHSGPSAEFEVYDKTSKIDESKRVDDCIQTSKIYARTMKEHLLFLLIEEDQKYLQVLQPIINFMESK